jgi:hypothetical protein
MRIAAGLHCLPGSASVMSGPPQWHWLAGDPVDGMSNNTSRVDRPTSTTSVDRRSKSKSRPVLGDAPRAATMKVGAEERRDDSPRRSGD